MQKAKLKIITSWDDGGENDPALAKLLSANGIRGIFFIPTFCLLTQDQVKQIAADHVIGGHTVSHYPDLKKLEPELLHDEIADNRKWLQELTSQTVDWFAYPRGRYNEATIEEVKRCGFTYARTTLVRHTDCENPYRQHTSAQVYPRKEYQGERWDSFATAMALMAAETNTTFHLWGHSDEIEAIGEWKALEDFFRWLGQTFELLTIKK